MRLLEMFLHSTILLLLIYLVEGRSILWRSAAVNPCISHCGESSSTLNVQTGLNNLGHTCFMNSVIQSLFTAEPYRRLVLESKFAEHSSGEELQRLFHKMSKCQRASVSPHSLAKTLGISINIQQDAEELFLQLINNVDESTVGGGVFPSRAIQINTLQQIDCINIPFSKKKAQKALDLSLEVRGHSGILEALRSHFKPDLLIDNSGSDGGGMQYRTPEHGMQDAIKRLSILSASSSDQSAHDDLLPKVIVFHLKRFQYDHAAGVSSKVDDLFGVPLKISLSEFLFNPSHLSDTGAFSSTCSSSNIPSAGIASVSSSSTHLNYEGDNVDFPRLAGVESCCDYELSSIVLHEGSLNSGHYVCLARTNQQSARGKQCGNEGNKDVCTGNKWVMLDDHIVSEVTEQQVLDMARGKKFPSIDGSSSNAYMVFYTKKRD